MESEVSYISRKLYIFIGIVGVLAASTHIYFIALCGLIVCGGVLSNILKQKSLKMGLSMMVVYIVSAGFTVFMLGGFSTKTSAGPTNELGLYSFNLNGLFNPLGWSCLLKDFKLYNPEQYEGFSYLGVGLIIILIVVMITWISDERITEKLNICRIDMLSVGIVVLVSLFISLGPIATFFERELYTLLLPDFIWKSWSVFRSTGRFVWVIIYAIDLLTIIFIYKLMNHKIAIRWLIFALCIQILDIHLVIQNKNEYFSQKIKYEDFTNDSPFWKKLGKDKEIKNIILVPNARFFDQKEGNVIINWALTNNKTLNSFYFSHDTSFGLVKENLQKSIERKSPEDLFVFPGIDSLGDILPGMNYYLYDNLVLG